MTTGPVRGAKAAPKLAELGAHVRFGHVWETPGRRSETSALLPCRW